MRRFVNVFVLLSLFLLPLPLLAAPDEDVELDMDEYLFGHVRDSYDWHVTTINGKQDRRRIESIFFQAS